MVTVVDINAGIGGRTRAFQDAGFLVLAAVENDKSCHKVFHQINPHTMCFTFADMGENGEHVPTADILTANITPRKESLANKEKPTALTHFLSGIILRDAPKMFVFQASTSLLKNDGFQFLEVPVRRRYSINYQVFKESDYSGFPLAGNQLYIIGIRNDLSNNNFEFPQPSYYTVDLPKMLESTRNIAPWYRQLPERLVLSQAPRVGKLYSRSYRGDVKETDKVTLLPFAESYYCDELGLRRLTHQEYAVMKGYGDCSYDFDNHSNRNAMYRMLFNATNLYLFNGIVTGVENVINPNIRKPIPWDWPAFEEVAAALKKTSSKNQRDSKEKLIKPRNRLLNIQVKRLKGINNLDISFSSTLTAIMGVNCSGKSTILHALACVFQPDEAGQDYKFNFFFTPNTDALWNDSELVVTYLDENTQNTITKEYRKKSDRWSPKYSTRPKREVFYLGIDSCSPEIEKERQTSYISYSTNTTTDRQAVHIKEALTYIMGKNYTEITSNKTKKKNMIGVCTSDELRYSALSMGAGEQRVFKLLQLVYSVPAFSLVLVDEIDLLLHVKALERLIETLSKIAKDRKLQIVFTTHSLVMRNLTDYVDIRYLYQTKEKTMVYESITPDIVADLTDTTERPLTVYVEDDLAEMIVASVIDNLEVTRFTSVKKYGSSENAFTLAAGLVLHEDTSLDIAKGKAVVGTVADVGPLRRNLCGQAQLIQCSRSGGGNCPVELAGQSRSHMTRRWCFVLSQQLTIHWLIVNTRHDPLDGTRMFQPGQTLANCIYFCDVSKIRGSKNCF